MEHIVFPEVDTERNLHDLMKKKIIPWNRYWKKLAQPDVKKTSFKDISNSLFPEDNKSYRIKQLHMNIGSFVANEQMQTIYTQYMLNKFSEITCI